MNTHRLELRIEYHYPSGCSCNRLVCYKRASDLNGPLYSACNGTENSLSVGCRQFVVMTTMVYGMYDMFKLFGIFRVRTTKLCIYEVYADQPQHLNNTKQLWPNETWIWDLGVQSKKPDPYFVFQDLHSLSPSLLTHNNLPTLASPLFP